MKRIIYILPLFLFCIISVQSSAQVQKKIIYKRLCIHDKSIELNIRDVYTLGELFKEIKWDGVLNNVETLKLNAPSTPQIQNVLFSAVKYSGEQIINGDFESGRYLADGVTPSFDSDYRYITKANGLWDAGTYTVGNSVTFFHNNFPASANDDHTTGTGNMFIANGIGQSNTIAWKQKITVLPNTNYEFSAWLQRVFTGSGSNAMLQFRVDGILMSTPMETDDTPGKWKRFYTIWNSGSKNSIEIQIVNQQTAPDGNDFAVDDLSFAIRQEVEIAYQIKWTDCYKDTICLGETYSKNGITKTPTSLGEMVLYDKDSLYEVTLFVSDNPKIKILPIQPLCLKTDQLILNLDLMKENTIHYNLDFKSPLIQDVFNGQVDASNPVIQIALPSDLKVDTYQATLEVIAGTANCTKEYSIEFERKLSDRIYQKWTNVLFCDNHDDLFKAYQWYNDNGKIEGATEQFIYLQNGTSGYYYVKAMTVDGKEFWTCPYLFDSYPRSATSGSIYPLPVQKNTPIFIELDSPKNQKMLVQIVNAFGVVIQDQSIYYKEQFSMNAPGKAGVYIVRIHNEEHTFSLIKKIIVL